MIQYISLLKSSTVSTGSFFLILILILTLTLTLTLILILTFPSCVPLYVSNPQIVTYLAGKDKEIIRKAVEILNHKLINIILLSQLRDDALCPATNTAAHMRVRNRRMTAR